MYETEQSEKISKYPTWAIAVIGIISFIAHGSMIFSNVIGVDTEAAILGIEAYDGQGRQGILWVRKLLGMSKFNLWLTNSLTFFLLIIVALFFFTTITARKKKLTKLLVPFGIIFIVSPYWACQLYFLSQSVPVLISLLLVPLVDKLFRKALSSKNLQRVFLLVLSSILFQFIVGTYQLNMIIYIAYVCCVINLESIHGEEAKESFRCLFLQAIFVIVGFVIYGIITHCFYSEYSNYLTGQIVWESLGVKQGFINIIHVIGDVFKGAVFYSFLYIPLCVVTFVLCIVNCLKTKRHIAQCIICILCQMVIYISPFFFVLLYGCDVTPRMKYIFPIVEALVLVLCYSEFDTFMCNISVPKNKVYLEKMIALLFCLLLFADMMKGLNNTTRLYYTNEWRFEHENLIAKDLQRDINQFFRDNELPEDERNRVIILGEVNFEYNELCLPGMATIGSSSLNWDSYIFTRGRIYKFLKVLGYSIGNTPYYSEGAFRAFEVYFDDYFGDQVDAMPAYPYNGYIQEVRNDDLGLYYYVVKLGDDWRKENFYNP